MVVKDLSDVPDQQMGHDVSSWLVVDLTGLYVVANCGDSQGRANKVAQALNDLDGGPL